MEGWLAVLLMAGGGAVGYLIHAVSARFVSIERRVGKLEEAQRTRNPYRTNEGLEDTVAVLLDVQRTLDYLDRRAEQARMILGQIRRQPDTYDSDKPNGKRVG